MKFFNLIGIGLASVSALTDFARDNVRTNFGQDRFITLDPSQVSQDLLDILDLHLHDQFGFQDGQHQLRVSPETIEALQSNGILFEDHTVEFLDAVERNLQRADFVCSEGTNACASKSADEFYETYHTMATYHKRLANLAAANPGITTLETLGTTFENKEQKIIKIGDDGEKPLIYYFCAIHAREWLTPPFCMHLVESLLDPSNVQAQNLLKVYSFAVTPVANPDGFEYTHTNDNFWRKTRTPTGSRNCIGTDPNRNWGFEWGGVGASTNPCSDTYRGSAPFDQKCVVNIRNFVDANQDRLIHINDVHSYGEYYLNPWGFTDEAPPAADFEKMEITNQALYDAILATSGQRFKVGPASTTIYPASGGSMDYFYGELGIVYAGVYEARSGGRSGFDGFQPETFNIKPSNEELFAGLYALADKVYELELCGDLENTNIFAGEDASEQSCSSLLNYCSRSEEVRQRCPGSCRTCSLEELVPTQRTGAVFLPSGGKPADDIENEEPVQPVESTSAGISGVFLGVILVVASMMVSLFIAYKLNQEANSDLAAATSTATQFNA